MSRAEELRKGIAWGIKEQQRQGKALKSYGIDLHSDESNGNA